MPIPTNVPASQPPPSSSNIPNSLEDENIYCPICNYNLTGILSGRCPECGSMFHRQALVEAQRANTVTLIPWDDPRPMSIAHRFWATLKISLFDPKRFALAFSVQPQHTRARSFFLITFVGVIMLAFGFLAGVVLIDQFFAAGGIFDIVLLSIGTVIYMTLLIPGCTLCTAIVLWLTSPHYDGKRHFRPWLSICSYAACHYLLIAIMVPGCLLATVMDGNKVIVLFWILAIGCGALCGFTLIAVMQQRTAWYHRNRLCYLMFILIYLFGPFISYALTVLVVIGVSLYLL